METQVGDMFPWLLYSLLIGCDLVESPFPSAESALLDVSPSHDGLGASGGGMDAGGGCKGHHEGVTTLTSAHLDFSEELVESLLCLGPV